MARACWVTQPMKQLSVDLQDRTLRFDGVSIISPDGVVDALLRGVPPSKLRLTHHTPDTELFNESADDQLLLAEPEPVNLNFEWLQPPAYLELDIYEKVGQAYEARLPELYARYTPQQYDEALRRVVTELAEIERRGMVDFFKTIIYVLDVFREKGVVWGVGRGSSCASYILYLLGLHSVDCVMYNVPHAEFFHT